MPWKYKNVTVLSVYKGSSISQFPQYFRGTDIQLNANLWQRDGK
jgi:hypothetical protein